MTEDITGLTAGVYTVLISNIYGCSFTDTYTVNTIPDITPPAIICPPAFSQNPDANCEIIIPDLVALASATDNCGPVTIVQNPVQGTIISGASGGQIIVVTLTATDASGNIAQCDVTITVGNNTPLAADDNISTNENTPVLIPVLLNDNFGCDGPSIGTITITIPPANGIVTVDDGGTPNDPTDDQILYTPNSGYNGMDSFNYSICDSDGDCSEATVEITIIGVNDPPVTFNEYVQMCQGTAYSGNVLINGDFDPDGTALTAITVPVAGPSNGTITILPNGDFTYTPFAVYSGNDMVIVSICDAGIPGVECTNDTIFITVDALIIANAGADLEHCNTTSVNLSGNDPLPGTGNWTLISGPNVPVISPANSSVVVVNGLIASVTPYVFEYTITNSTCVSSDQLVLTNYELPTTAIAGNNQDVCAALPASVTMNANTPVTGIGTWAQLSGPGIAVIADPNNPATLITGLIQGIYVFEWTISNGVCAPSTSSMQVSIAQPVTAFAGNDATICETQAVYTLSAATATNYLSLLWTSSGSGTFNNSSLLNPDYTPSAADISSGSIILTLNATGNVPCAGNSDQMVLNISRQVAANAGNDDSICETQVSYVLASATASNYASLQWTSSGSGSFSNPGILNPVYTPSAADISAGNVDLILTAYSFAGCVDVSDTITLTIAGQVSASAGPDDIICETLGLYSISGASATNYSSITWTTSGSGTFNNPGLVNPVYTPGIADIISGSVTLQFLATGVSPCVDVIDAMTLNISRQSTADAGPDEIICETQVDYTLASAVATNFTSLLWTTSGTGTFNDATIVNPVYTPSPADITTGNIILTITTTSLAPCSDVTDAMILTIVGNATADAGPDANACMNTPFTITGATANNYSTLVWTHNGTGTLTGSNSINPTYTPAGGESGPIILTLKAYSIGACADSAQDQMMLMIYPLPTAVLSGGSIVCENDTVNLHVTFTGNSPWNLTYTNGTTSTTINNITSNPFTFSVVAPAGSTTYSLVALSDVYCSATSAQLSGTALIIGNPVPVTDFTANSACVGDTTYFVATGAYMSSITSMIWNFGDGTYGSFNTGGSTYHIYQAYGTYTVTLTVADSVGCSYTTSHNVGVRPPPMAFFNSSSPQCAGSPIVFTDLSSNPSGQGYIQQWAWDFGDGTPVQTIVFPASPNLSHSYTNAGVYTVTLLITNSLGCIDSYSSNVSVLSHPVADFTFTSNCVNQITQFTDASLTNGIAQVSSWIWNFGDPLSGTLNTSALQNPQHIYTTAGTYSVMLIVSNAGGCYDTTYKTVTVNPAPVAEFIYSAGCVNAPTYFWADSTLMDINAIAAYTWNFGDGGTSNSRNTQHTYLAPGNYMVTLSIQDTVGCSGSVSHNIIVTVPPVAHFSANIDNCSGQPVQFTDLSTSVAGYNSLWVWDFGDGTSQSIAFPNNPNVTHAYTLTGTYFVKLTVTNNLGCSSYETKTIVIASGPQADFMYAGRCQGSPVSFTDISTAASTIAINAWAWNFGDPTSGINNSSALQNPSHVYANPGNYTVRLITWSNSGCSDTVTKTVVIRALPPVDFTTQGSCQNTSVLFTPGAVININTIATWFWQFGDGGTSTLTSPAHIYASVGNYTATLTITDTAGCSNTINRPISIVPAPVVNFTVHYTCLQPE